MKCRLIIKLLLLIAITALFAAAQTPTVAPPKPLTRAQIIALLAGDVPSARVTMLVEERGINFASNDAFLDQVRKSGGDDDLVNALQSSRVTKRTAAPSPTAAQIQEAQQEDAKQAELAQHAARGAELFQDKHYAQAEAEYREAIKLDPQNSDLHMALARALNSQKKRDEGMEEARLAISLNPQSDMAHFALGNALRMQEDWAGAAAEFREAVRLNPNYDMSHNNLGVILKRQNDTDGAIAEFREALRLNPEEVQARGNLGNTLESQGDLDGAIAQFEELERQKPQLAVAHFRLGQLLEKKGEPQRAEMEYLQATGLAPRNAQYKEAYERSLKNQ